MQSHLSSATEIELRLDGDPSGTVQSNQEITLRYNGNSLLPPEAIELVDQVRKQEMVVHLDQAITSMHKQIEKFGEVMESVQDVIGDEELRDNVRDSLANIRAVTERANRIGENVEKLTVSANATVARTNDSVDHLSRQMGTDLEKLGQVFGQLATVADKINNGKGTAGAGERPASVRRVNNDGEGTERSRQDAHPSDRPVGARGCGGENVEIRTFPAKSEVRAKGHEEKFSFLVALRWRE